MSERTVSGSDPDTSSWGPSAAADIDRYLKFVDEEMERFNKEIYKREIDTWAAFGEQAWYITVFSNDWSYDASTKTMRLYMNYYAGGDPSRSLTVPVPEHTPIPLVYLTT
ncbi:hypothetical protein GQ44DRAFT_779125 [Phaeosphaeriaceae sp. PMI808]|nr:hypothetical protein GQ44DRAFT_779125 [Phaeosphaeriaceae sp. PMI808]